MRTRPLDRVDLIPYFLNYWKTSKKFAWPQQPNYIGTGLHYNKNIGILPVESQICGNHYNIPEYQDSMSFDQPVNDILKVFDSFSMVRCKITSMAADDNNFVPPGGHIGWHRDETPFECLRVIIPLSSDTSYLFQMDNQQPIAMIPGFAYAFDQSIHHRVFSTKSNDVERVHLVLSFVTWFDRIEDQWIPNCFFNKTHPLELFDAVDL